MLCSQMALAAVVSVIADRYITFMTANARHSGTSRASHCGRRTAGSSNTPANSARQKAKQHSPRLGRPALEDRGLGEQSARAPHDGGQRDPKPSTGDLPGRRRSRLACAVLLRALAWDIFAPGRVVAGDHEDLWPVGPGG